MKRIPREMKPTTAWENAEQTRAGGDFYESDAIVHKTA